MKLATIKTRFNWMLIIITLIIPIFGNQVIASNPKDTDTLRANESDELYVQEYELLKEISFPVINFETITYIFLDSNQEIVFKGGSKDGLTRDLLRDSNLFYQTAGKQYYMMETRIEAEPIAKK